MRINNTNRLFRNLNLDKKDAEYVIKFSFTRSAIIAISVMIMVQYIFTFLYSLDLVFKGGDVMFKHFFQTFSAFLFILILSLSIITLWNKTFIFTPSYVYRVEHAFLFMYFPKQFKRLNIRYNDIIELKVKKNGFIHIKANKELNTDVSGDVKSIDVKEMHIPLEWKYRRLFGELVSFLCEKAKLQQDPNLEHIYHKKE